MRKFIIVLTVLFSLIFVNKGIADDLSKSHTHIDGEVLTAAHLNNNIDPLYSTINDLDGENLASDIAITTSGNASFSGTLTSSGSSPAFYWNPSGTGDTYHAYADPASVWVLTNVTNNWEAIRVEDDDKILLAPTSGSVEIGTGLGKGVADFVVGGTMNVGGVTTFEAAVTGTTFDINGGTIANVVFDGGWTAAGQTCADLGTVTTANIDGGTLDDVTITTGGKLTAGSNEVEGSNFDINGGVITGITDLATADGGTGSSSTTYCDLTANVTGTLPIANGGTGATTGISIQSGASVTMSAAQLNLVSGTAAIVTFDTVTGTDQNFDIASEYDTGNYKFTLGTDGKYQVYAQINFTQVIADKEYELEIFINNTADTGPSTTVHSTSTDNITATVQGTFTLETGDYITVKATSNADANTVDIVALGCIFSIIEI